MPDKKRVVYLLGAGATQAERNHAGLAEDPKDLLIEAVTKRVIKECQKNPAYKEIIDKFAPEGPKNIEQFITLLDSMKVETYNNFVNHLKKLFRLDIKKRTGGLESVLTMALMEMHNISELDEELVGIVTTNYDIVIDTAIRKFGNKIDYGFSCNPSFNNEGGNKIILIKLHGSFDWVMETPIKIAGRISDSDGRTLWVPPGVHKEFAYYPFNILWGKAVELFDCDVIRVIGSSLNQNDWEILSLLFRTQLLHRNGVYRIELIIHNEPANTIIDNYSFLRKVVRLRDIPGCSGAGAIGDKTDFSPFKFWLQCKGRKLIEDEKINIGKLKYFNGIVEEGVT